MGRMFTAQCRRCGYKFPLMDGGGRGWYQLRCVSCGKSRRFSMGDAERRGIDFKDLEAIEKAVGTCDCGGSFSRKAPPRCPECGSVEIKTINPIGHYD